MEQVATSTESDFEILIFEGPEGCSVSVAPERGGIITSIVLAGREILFMNRETFGNPEKNVRGGIPNLFPFSGPATDGIRERYPELTRQHGFARNADAWTCVPLPDGRRGFRETLASDSATRSVFPFAFEYASEGEFSDDSALTIRQVVSNTGAEPMPVSMGLHPYFAAVHDRRRDVRFDFPGGERVAREYGHWTNGGTTKIDNPGALAVGIPGLGTIRMEVSPEYRKVFVWSEGPEDDYVCIEPVMRDDGGLVADPEMIPPGATFETLVTYRLEPEM